MSIAACTVVTRNHLAFARLAGRSWIDHHPDSSFTIVVVDHESMPSPTWTHRDIRIVGPATVGIDAEALRTLAAIYDAGELACALKPWALRLLLREVEAAVYIDGDVEVLDGMHDLEPLARRHGVVLSSHNLHPLPEDGCLPDHFTMLKAGMFNGGLLAVGRGGTDFLDWWAARLRRDGIHEPQEGMHGDQRWLDFVPTTFEHHILRDPTFNVAYWNLHERPSSWDGASLCVSGRRVRCFHYSGLLDQTPWSLSQFMGDVPRIRLRDHPAAARLCRGYLDRLGAAGLEADRALGYRFGATAGGTPVDRRARRLWRDQLIASETDLAGAGLRAPNPFDDDGGTAWLDWLRAPADDSIVSRYLERVWDESATLQRTFPRLDDPLIRDDFLAWAIAAGADAADIPETLLPDPKDLAMDGGNDSDTRPRRRPPRPDVRAQQPLTDLDSARESLERPAGEGGSRPLRRMADKVLATRDERSDEIARHLVDAVNELNERIAELGERVNRVNDELPEQGERMDELDDRSGRLANATENLEQRLDQLDGTLVSERRRVEGALEQDVITAGILADAEARLTAEVHTLGQRLEKLSADADPGGDTPKGRSDSDDSDSRSAPE